MPPDRDAAFREAVEERFWSKVYLDTTERGCWLWMAGTKNKDGYGDFRNEVGRMVPTHRHSWEMHYGPIPTGMQVCHHCDTPRCIRPDHLFLGDHAANAADRDRKGRTNHHGAANANARLTDEQVAEIRRLYGTGTLRQQDIADQFGIGQVAVSGIVRGARWRHVPGDRVRVTRIEEAK